MRARTLWFWIALIAGLGGLGVIAAARLRNGKAATAEARRAPFHVVVAATGKVEPIAEVLVSSKTQGRLATVDVRQGDRVKAGQRLASLESKEIEARLAAAEAAEKAAQARSAELEAGSRPEEIAEAKSRVAQAEASLAWAERECERWANVAHEGAASGRESEEARAKRDESSAALEAARAVLARLEAGPRTETKAAARAEVNRCAADVAYVRSILDSAIIAAPFDGLVLKRHLEPGDVVAVERQTPIITLADVREIRVRCEIDETDFRWIAVGQPAVITSDALPGESFPGKVVEVGSQMGKKSLRTNDPGEMVDTRVLEAKVAVAEHPHLLLALMVDVLITVDDRPDVLQVPLRAVTRQDGRGTVQVRSSTGAFVEKTIVCGASDGLMCEVREGLTEGDVVRLPERR